MENKLVPTHKYKTSVVFLDDDINFLNFLKGWLISDNYEFHFVNSQTDLENFIRKSEEQRNKLPPILTKLDNELNDLVNHEAFDFDLSRFMEIRNIPNKSAEMSVIFIDNDLGDYSGIDICSRLSPRLRFKKILLTGDCDKMRAIDALNKQVINLFIDKIDLNDNTSSSIVDKVLEEIKNFSDYYFIGSNFYNNPLISSTSFKKLFDSILEQYKIIEYYLLEKDMFLLIDNQNREIFFKCWQDADFDNYYKIYFDDLDNSKNTKLKTAMLNKQIPVGHQFIDSVQFNE
ncbi:MAG: response regulator, partial [Burkholderiales bacterium]|nr:response regulator [Burkholderiales bacterium]